MARYIDADNFRKTMIKRFGCIPCLTDYSEASRYDIPLDDALNLEPTVDVVPKSEVEELIRENKSLAKTVNEASELIHKLRSKVKKSKTEVDNLKVLLEMKEKAYEGLKELYDTDTEALVKAREKTEEEVAWEIFEEIESMLVRYTFEDGYGEYISTGLEDEFAEIKKKYIGGNDNG